MRPPEMRPHVVMITTRRLGALEKRAAAHVDLHEQGLT